MLKETTENELTESDVKSRIISGHVSDIYRWVQCDDIKNLVEWLEDVIELNSTDTKTLASWYKCYFTENEINNILGEDYQ